MDVVKLIAGDFEYCFYVEINAAKTFKEFCDHEKHHGLTKEQLKEVHDLCKANSKVPVEKKKKFEEDTERPE